jgi:hypothetical protein
MVEMLFAGDGDNEFVNKPLYMTEITGQSCG